MTRYRKIIHWKRLDSGQKLRRCKQRRSTERTGSWFIQSRRLVVRHKHSLFTCYALFYITCFSITLRKRL
ncbi:MAG: hypothetical protein ACLGQU_00145 [Acidobacteriota bacterium]